MLFPEHVTKFLLGIGIPYYAGEGELTDTYYYFGIRIPYLVSLMWYKQVPKGELE